MNYKNYLLALGLGVSVAGCTSIQQATGMDDKTATITGGATFGCLGGAVLATALGKDAGAGCLAGAIVGGLIGFENARKAEIEAAERAKAETMEAFAELPAKDQPKTAEVTTREVVVTDKKTRERKTLSTFDSVSVDIPLSTIGTPEYDKAIAKLKALATRVADERGSAEIKIGYAPKEVKARKIKLETASVNTTKGNPITVTKVEDTKIPKNVERYTVIAGALKETEI